MQDSKILCTVWMSVKRQHSVRNRPLKANHNSFLYFSNSLNNTIIRRISFIDSIETDKYRSFLSFKLHRVFWTACRSLNCRRETEMCFHVGFYLLSFILIFFPFHFNVFILLHCCALSSFLLNVDSMFVYNFIQSRVKVYASNKNIFVCSGTLNIEYKIIYMT